MKSSQILAILILLITSLSALSSFANTSEDAVSADVVIDEALPVNWEYLSSDAEKTTYILKDSLQYSGKDVVEAWYLWDYKLQQIGQADRKFMSMKQLSKFSCQSHTAQMLSVAMYAEKMGTGALVAMANLKDQAWIKIAPLSGRAVIFKYLCPDKPYKKEHP